MKPACSHSPAFNFLADLRVSADYTANYVQVRWRERGKKKKQSKQRESSAISHVAPLSHLAGSRGCGRGLGAEPLHDAGRSRGGAGI